MAVLRPNDYYGGTFVRDVCHAVKSDDGGVRKAAVAEMAGWYIRSGAIDGGCVLVPVPQHSGRADYTLEVCGLVSDACGCMVADVLRAVPHEPLYDQKRRAGKVLFTGLYMVGGIAGRKRILLIDNVASTGATMAAILGLLPGAVPLPYAVVSQAVIEGLGNSLGGAR